MKAARLVLVAVAAIGPPADAHGKPGRRGTLTDAANHYRIAVAPGWRAVTPPEGTLVAYRSPGGRAYLAIARFEIGTRRARDPAALAGAVERGLERVTPGFRRIRRKLGEAASSPVLDLWYERESDLPRVLARYLFFARSTLVLSIGLEPGAGRSDRRAAEAMLKSFIPFQP